MNTLADCAARHVAQVVSVTRDNAPSGVMLLPGVELPTGTKLYAAPSDLLVKYIRYVRQCEGIDFISGGYRGYTGDQTFTPEEWAELQQASEDAMNEHAG